MHPDLVENPTFLRYYEKWQRDPTSVVFAAISEIFRSYGLIEDAIKIADAGLKHHPELVSGHLAIAKAYVAKGEKDDARRHLLKVLELVPRNIEGQQLLDSITEAPPVEQVHIQVPPAPLPEPSLDLRPEDFEEDEITEDMPFSMIRIKDDAELDEEMERYSKLSAGPATEDSSVSEYEAWYTVTMARILAGQGHTERARKIYKAILSREPNNEAARRELADL